MCYKDIIIELSKLDIPENDGYICLGHFDCAKISSTDDQSKTNNFRLFASRKRITESKDQEGLQRNYLVNSGKTFGKESDDAIFKFLMTISVKKTPSRSTLQKCVESFIYRLESDSSNMSFFWEFYYPVSRGDIIVILSGNDFALATKALYSFVDGNDIVIYSYTIPMIKKEWLASEYTQNKMTEDDNCLLRLKTIVKNYKEFYDLIDKINIECEDGYPKFLASFGTDDVQVDFGAFTEKKLHAYLHYVISDEGQASFRETVFSAELDIPRIINRKETKQER